MPTASQSKTLMKTGVPFRLRKGRKQSYPIPSSSSRSLMICSGMCRNQRILSSTITKSFRLPILQPPRNFVRMERGDAAGRRIMTYLPPPMYHAPSNGSMSKRSGKPEKSPPVFPSSATTTSYHPPSDIGSSYSSYRPLSPPTSDPPVVSSHGADVWIQPGLDRYINDNEP